MPQYRVHTGWTRAGRDRDRWGYYGHQHAEEELRDQFNATIKEGY